MGNRSAKQGPSTRTIVPNHTVPEDTLAKNHPNATFANNRVKTTKYTIWNFIPLNLWDQFHRFANIYFIFIVILNFMPEITAFAKEIAPIPVAFVLAVTAVKDAYEDYRRYKADKKVNHSITEVLNKANHCYEKCEWQQLRAGDIVCIRSGDAIPADILLLHSSDDAGICYIETSNIDGETNLKQRDVIRGIDVCNFQPKDFRFPVVVDLPNNEIYKFNGTVIMGNSASDNISVHKENIILRGCIIRNTDYIEGIVIYAGRETKSMLNNQGPRFKRSKLERQINKDVIWCVILLVIFCLTGALGSGIWLNSFSNRSDVLYLVLTSGISTEPAYQAFINFWTFIIIFQAMIPLPLYVTIEFVKLGQVYFITNDLGMYDEERDKPMECKALNITEDLGQIQYVFSDKTGTLTENKMEFKRCCVNGTDYRYHSRPGVSEMSSHSSRPILGKDFGADTARRIDNVNVNTVKVKSVEVNADNACSMEDLQQAVKSFSFTKRVESSLNNVCSQRNIQEFMLAMAVCNTVVVSLNKADHHPSVAESSLRIRRHSRPALLNMKEESENSENKDIPLVHLGDLPPLSARPLAALQAVQDPEEYADEVFDESLLCPSPYNDSDLCQSYEAESPDELSLVKTACLCNCKLIQRGAQFISVWMPRDGLTTISVLHIFPFDSTRKRMSIILRLPHTKEVLLLCKGADSAILPRLLPSTDDAEYQKMLKRTYNLIEAYSKEGLRTLVLCKKLIPENVYNEWLSRHQKADTSFVHRELAVQKLVDEIERDFFLLGVTAIEDRLQDGVPDTIHSLRLAGINVWVLTGDKQETAIQIAYSAKLFSADQRLLTINAGCLESATELVRNELTLVTDNYVSEVEVRQGRVRPRVRSDLALVVDGATLSFCLHPQLRYDFLLLAEQCSSVVCCRATPHQKAEVVSLVKENLRMQTLAIGDGANDVNMIQTADIGVGLSGQEGMQAMMAADFTLSRFCFLKRLLLLHGHWSYDRLARISLYMFYKDTVFIMLLFWFQVFNGFSGQSCIGQLYMITFNLTMTSLPPIIVGIFDIHIKEKVIMNNPALYRDGQNCRTYLPWHFWINIGDAIWQSLVLFFLPWFVYNSSDIDLWMFGDVMCSACCLTSIVHMGLETRSWTGFHWLAIVGSPLVAWFGFALVYNFVCSFDCMHPDNPYYVIVRGIQQPTWWLTQLLSISLALLPRFVVRATCNSLYPSRSMVAMRLQSEHPLGDRLHVDDPVEECQPFPMTPMQPVSTHNGIASLASNKINTTNYFAASSQERETEFFDNEIISRQRFFVNQNEHLVNDNEALDMNDEEISLPPPYEEVEGGGHLGERKSNELRILVASTQAAKFPRDFLVKRSHSKSVSSQ